MIGWLVAAAALAGAVVGALWGWRRRQRATPKPPLSLYPTELPHQVVLQKRELGNFLHYDGEEMPDPEQPARDA